MKFEVVAFAVLSIAMAGTAAEGQSVADPLRRLQNAALAHAKSETKDEFSEPPSAGSALGAPFRFVVPLNSGRSTESANTLSSGFYEYADGQLTAYLRHWFGPVEAFEPANVTSLGSYRAETAFGRRMMVQRERIEKVGVAMVNVNLPDDHARADRKFQAFPHTIQISGGDARALASSLHYEIEGNIHTFDDGRSVACKTVRSNPPTLDRPLRFTYYSCTVAVTVSRIALVDGRTGKAIRTWDESDIASAPH